MCRAGRPGPAGTVSGSSARPARGGNGRGWGRGRRRRRWCRWRTGRGQGRGGRRTGVVGVPALRLVPLVCLLGRGSVDGRADGRLDGHHMVRRTLGIAGEQYHQTGRGDRTELNGSPGEPGQAPQCRGPRVHRMVVAEIGIEVRPGWTLRQHRARRIRRLAGRGGVVRRGVVRGGVVRGGVAARWAGRAAFRQTAMRMAGIGVWDGPVGPPEPGGAGRLRRTGEGVRAGPARRRNRGTARGSGWPVSARGAVVRLAVARPVRAPGRPGPTV